jgi:hypothetical protein
LSARLIVAALSALATAGCYDVDALSRSAVNDGGAGDGGGGAGGTSGAGPWRTVASPSTAPLRGVFGDSATLFAVGASSTIMRLDATAAPVAESAPPGWSLRAVWSGGGSTVAVGDTGVVLTRGAAGWDGFSVVDATFYAVAASAGSEPLVAGSGGTIMQHATTGWMGEDAGVGVQLRGAVNRAGGDVLVVGDAGTIVRGVGATPPLGWTTEPNSAPNDLCAVWSTGSDTFIVGTGGLVLHAGADDAWATEASGTSADLMGVFGAGDVVFAVGAGGTILERKNGAWSVARTGGADLHAVWAAATASTIDAWAVGDGGTILHRTP